MLTHRMSNSPVHKTWMRMNNRCNNPNYDHYHRYGGRGIKVCERWKSFENFYGDVSPSWRPGLTLDRYPDVDGDYEPSNFRWATVEQQCNNRSTSSFVSFNGFTKTISEWSKSTGINRRTIEQRLKAGWKMEHVFSTPVRLPNLISDMEIINLHRSGMSVRSIAKSLAISRETVSKFINNKQS